MENKIAIMNLNYRYIHTLFCNCVSPSIADISFGRIQPPAWLLFETKLLVVSTVVSFKIGDSLGTMNGDDLTPPVGEVSGLISGSSCFGATGSAFSGASFSMDVAL